MSLLLQVSQLSSDNLDNPNKSRARGPAGRKPPSRKWKTKDDEIHANELTKANQNFPHTLHGETSENHYFPTAHVNSSGEQISGKIKPADFDKVWFFCVPATTTPLHNKEQCERHSININNTISSSSNSAANEETQSKTFEDKNGIEVEKENDCELAKSKSKKLKPWRSCEIM